MRTTIRICGMLSIIFLIASSQGYAKSSRANTAYPAFGVDGRFLLPVSFPEPRCTFDTMWVDYDVTQENVRGMLMHLTFTVYELKDVSSDIAVFFEYNDDRGGRIKDKNQKFASQGGDVAVYRSLKPQYDAAYFKDLQLFMPYDELDLRSGKYDLTMVVNLIYEDGTLIQHLENHNFQFTNP